MVETTLRIEMSDAMRRPEMSGYGGLKGAKKGWKLKKR